MIYCCGCGKKVEARLTNGAEVYPHRPDLSALPFWKCDACGNAVGCHHKTDTPTKPLGCIPTKEIKNARGHIHKLLDPMWIGKGRKERNRLYALITEHMGFDYHTACIRSIEEARKVYRFILTLRNPTNDQQP